MELLHFLIAIPIISTVIAEYVFHASFDGVQKTLKAEPEGYILPPTDPDYNSVSTFKIDGDPPFHKCNVYGGDGGKLVATAERWKGPVKLKGAPVDVKMVQCMPLDGI